MIFMPRGAFLSAGLDGSGSNVFLFGAHPIPTADLNSARPQSDLHYSLHRPMSRSTYIATPLPSLPKLLDRWQHLVTALNKRCVEQGATIHSARSVARSIPRHQSIHCLARQ